MAFPQTVLPVRVRIAPGGSPAADPATWVWVDITADVRVASGITITEGRSDEGAEVDPGTCTLTLDNTAGNYSTRNVYGTWYGKLAKGTPLRVGTIAVSDAFNRTVSNGWGTADTGQTWGISGTASLWSVSPSGAAQLSFTAANVANAATAIAAELLDVDGQFTVSVPAVMTGASQIVALLFRWLDGNNFYMASCEFNTGGTVTSKLRSTIAGVTTELATTGNIAGLTYTANQKLRLRVQADGPALRTKAWVDGNTEPSAWNLAITDTQITQAGRVGIYEWCVSGNTNTKPYTVTVDSLEVEAIEFTGGVYEWPPRWDQPRKDATTPITASGILRRLQQGKSPLRSPIARMLVRNNPVAYWELADDSDATSLAPGIPGVTAGKARSVEFAQTDLPLAGAKQTAGITASTVMSGQVPTHTATGTWGCVFFAYLLAPPAANTQLIQISASGSIKKWEIVANSTQYVINGYDANSTLVVNLGMNWAGLPVIPPAWVAFDVLIKQSGGNIVATLLTYAGIGDTGIPTMYSITQTVAGTVGSPTGWSMQGSLGFNQGSMAHVVFFNYEPPFVTYAFANAANGYLAEAAADRIARLCAEEGVQVVVEPGTSEPLGPQRTDTFLNLLYSAQDADLGILYERGAGLAYRPRGARYNRAVEIALDFAVGDVAEPPEPTDDDQQLVNQWTVSRDSGSSAVDDNPASIAASGLIDDSTTINVATDDVLANHASWRLTTTTVDELRWPSIKLNLARNTAQIRSWRAAQPFPRVTIANEPSQVAGNAVDVTALGYTQTMDPFGWGIELNSTPSSPYSDIAVYGTTRYNSASTSTAGTLTATTGSGVSLPLSTVNLADCWSTTSLPYNVEIIPPGASAGEVVTVTAMTARAGSGPYTQTATITRAANGIVMAHAIGEQVLAAARGRYAL